MAARDWKYFGGNVVSSVKSTRYFFIVDRVCHLCGIAISAPETEGEHTDFMAQRIARNQQRVYTLFAFWRRGAREFGSAESVRIVLWVPKCSRRQKTKRRGRGSDFLATVHSYGVWCRPRRSAPQEREIHFASLNEVSCVTATGTPSSLGTVKRNEFRAPMQWVLVPDQGCRSRKKEEGAVEGTDRV
jgi:hypothetical protein